MRLFGFLVFIVVYFFYVSLKFGAGNGFLITLLTWSFFVLCTPIADAGFILALPARLFFGLRMIYTQIIVYFIAIGINLFSLAHLNYLYNNTLVLKLFRQILTTSWPDWLIIFLSLIGTFLSIYFGDELLDVSKHSQRHKYHKHMNKYHLIVIAFIVILTIIVYNFLLKQIGINIPLI